MRLASNGNLTLSDSLGVGTGTTAPNSRLQIKKDGTGNYANQTFSNANSTAGITFGIAGSGTGNYLANNAFLLNTGASAFIFGTNDTERMRITSAGALCLGKTEDNTTADGVTVRKHPSTSHGQIWCVGAASSSAEGLYVYDRTNSEFEFYASYHGTLAYRSLYNMSDERKKQNIQDITLGLDAIKELRPVSFDWKKDKGDNQLGFIAQEVEDTSLKQLVGKYKDPNIDDLRSLNKEQMIPVLVKAIQELSTKLEAAEARITTLEEK